MEKWKMVKGHTFIPIGTRRVRNVSKERLGWRYWPTVYFYETLRFIRYAWRRFWSST